MVLKYSRLKNKRLLIEPENLHKGAMSEIDLKELRFLFQEKTQEIVETVFGPRGLEAYNWPIAHFRAAVMPGSVKGFLYHVPPPINAFGTEIGCLHRRLEELKKRSNSFPIITHCGVDKDGYLQIILDRKINEDDFKKMFPKATSHFEYGYPIFEIPKGFEDYSFTRTEKILESLIAEGHH